MRLRVVLLEAVALLEREILDAVERLLGQTQTERALGGDLVGERARGRHQLVGLHHGLDRAESVELARVHELAGEEHLARLVRADHALQVASAAEHAGVDLGEREARVLRRDDHVARCDEREPRADRGAVDGADHGNRAVADGEEALAGNDAGIERVDDRVFRDELTALAAGRVG